MSFYYPNQPNQPTSTLVSSSSRPHKRLCSVSGCRNGVVQGGVCVAHGAKRRKCQVPGCDKNSKCAGKCSRHGPPRKKCEHEGCTNVSVRGGKCKSHGAVSKRCEVEDCQKVAVTEGMCRKHAWHNTQGVEPRPAASMPQDPPFSPIVRDAPPEGAAIATARRGSSEDSSKQNSSVIAQNNYVVENKLSQVIEAHNRLSSGANYAYSHEVHNRLGSGGNYAYSLPHAGAEHPHLTYGHGYPSHHAQPPYPYRSADEERGHGHEHSRYYYG